MMLIKFLIVRVIIFLMSLKFLTVFCRVNFDNCFATFAFGAVAVHRNVIFSVVRVE